MHFKNQSEFNDMIYVVSFSEKSDEIKDEDGLNCTFKRDISGFEYALNNSLINTDIANMSLEQLLEGFFKFYASLDYNSVTIWILIFGLPSTLLMNQMSHE